jgi:lipopolysaccharide heptosyltransferase II
VQRAIDWSKVRRVLIVKLRSIGDTVLSTPSIIALRRFLPNAEIDILLEDWVAPVLDGFLEVSRVVSVGKGSATRFRVARDLRKQGYDVAFNLHGGTTGTFFTFATGARHRVGFAEYQYSFLYNHLLTSAADFWGKPKPHSAEQQMALLGFLGVPVDPKQRTQLEVTSAASRSIDKRISEQSSDLAIIHPTAAFATKRWAIENFARTAEFLAGKGFDVIALASMAESSVLEELKTASKAPITTFTDLSLPEITAIASKARLFVGNDSGIAHIAAAVNTPSVVIFGSSNRDNWRPWTDARNEIVFEEFACQPCPGYVCNEFGEPKCILSVQPEKVFAAIDRILQPLGNS